MVFVDFRKAFDVVDHQLLLTKLRLYRVSDPSLSWFESYLSGRQQFVSIDGQSSDSLLIKQGVPQGSVLCPALFFLFVKDIPLHLTNSHRQKYRTKIFVLIIWTCFFCALSRCQIRPSPGSMPQDTLQSKRHRWTKIPSIIQKCVQKARNYLSNERFCLKLGRFFSEILKSEYEEISPWSPNWNLRCFQS